MKNLLILLLLCLSILSCRDTGNGCETLYTFEVEIEFTPNKAVYNVGDTLNVRILTDNENMVDLYDTGRIVNFPYFDPKAWFIMPSLDKTPFIDGFVVNEVIIDSVFGISQPQLAQGTSGIFFLSIDSSAVASRIEMDIILNEKGMYALYSETSLDIFDEDEFVEFPDRCGGRCCSLIEARYTIESDHKEILDDNNKQIEDIYWEDFKGQRIRSTPYYFKVE